MKPFVLGLTGPGGSGKSTVARKVQDLVEDAGGPRVVIAHPGYPLKAMLAAFYEAAGLEPMEAHRRVDGDLKRTPCPLLCGRTPTEAQQTLGTEWGRNLIGVDLWLDRWRDRVARLVSESGAAVVNDSVRFENEAAAVRDLGGLVVRLTGRRDPNMPAHASEAGVGPDLEIENSGTPFDTAARLLDAIASRL